MSFNIEQIKIELLLNKYPNYEIIKEIGSGMNMNRKGLRKVIDYAIEGKIEELVITYKDRLARFGYNLIEDLIKKYSNKNTIMVKNYYYNIIIIFYKTFYFYFEMLFV